MEVETNPTDELFDEIVYIQNRILIDRADEQRFLFFWMALIEFRLYTEERNEMQQLIYMVKQIQDELEEVGIILEAVDTEGTLEVRYERIKAEISCLPPDKFILYQHLYDEEMKRKKAKDEQD